MNHNRIAPLAVLLAGLLSGCAANKSPTFHVESFSLAKRSQHAAVLHVTLLGTNPSNTPLQLRTINYTIAFDSLQQTTTTRQAQTTLPANSQQTLTLPIVLDTQSLDAMLDTQTIYQFRAIISYRRPGKFAEVLYDLGIQRASKTFSEQGTITIPSQQSPD